MVPISLLIGLSFVGTQSVEGTRLVPAAPVMTVYHFNDDHVPVYDARTLASTGRTREVGALEVGTNLIPCLQLHRGKPLTDAGGTPYVGFEVVLEPSKATPAAVQKLAAIRSKRERLRVADHHCRDGNRRVVNVRSLITSNDLPYLPSLSASTNASTSTSAVSQLDAIVRAFHNSPQCAKVAQHLLHRRERLEKAWDAFAAGHADHWAKALLSKAKHLDYAMRTALFEGHQERGCTAYGACERNIILLSLRNRARTECHAWQGCREPGDIQGVASTVTQYNIWDEFPAQVSPVSSCFLRHDEGANARLAQMYTQNVADAETILFGDWAEVDGVFPDVERRELDRLRHYYHPPAMGKCFPTHPRLEYISGATARRNNRFILLANTRIQVDEKTPRGYTFRDAVIDYRADGDVVEIVDRYPGFVVDGRKISLQPSSSCSPYGLPDGCKVSDVGRYRKTPFWLDSGHPARFACEVVDRGASCSEQPRHQRVEVGGACDTEMQPISAVH